MNDILHTTHPDSILIIDFGSQVTQLIARRVREAGVYCEIVPFQLADEGFARMKPKGVIFSGGPDSVTREGSPRAPQAVFDSGVPILAICYGQQTLCTQIGGSVEGGHHREFGRADVEILKASPLFEGFWEVGKKYPVWMSHGDRVTRLPEGFEVIGTSPNAPFAIGRREAALLHHNVPPRSGAHARWRETAVELRAQDRRPEIRLVDGRLPRRDDRQKIRDQVGSGKVICGLSGGVDSSVAAC
jgi:GMP synthase (glutamine-hydrolysing)